MKIRNYSRVWPANSRAGRGIRGAGAGVLRSGSGAETGQQRGGAGAQLPVSRGGGLHGGMRKATRISAGGDDGAATRAADARGGGR